MVRALIGTSILFGILGFALIGLWYVSVGLIAFMVIFPSLYEEYRVRRMGRD